mmetsp:Transcript_19095/g.35638  ORF Transcript_19095/g.35638 Transcript_19095/m.35638 type:complete len:287 (-) Transcript_19095:204-1064(-)
MDQIRPAKTNEIDYSISVESLDVTLSFFLKRDENSVAYLGDFNWIERANETGALSKKNIFGSSDVTHKEVPSHLRARDEATHSVQAKKSVSSTILSPMIRETDRLSGFIRRYENKLETVCKSLLAVASEDNDNKEEILSAKELPLPEMLDFIVQQEWYNAQSSTSVNSLGQPKLLFSRSGMGQSTNKSNQDAAKETTTDKGGKSNDNIYTITAVGKAFIDMDGPLHADVGRFLAHLNGASQGMKRTVMLENWREISRLSGDVQSRRVFEKLDDLISFCLESHMITQ